MEMLLSLVSGTAVSFNKRLNLILFWVCKCCYALRKAENTFLDVKSSLNLVIQGDLEEQSCIQMF